MIDKFNREINYLRVSITDRCNLRCQYCMPKEGVSLIGHQDILSYEEILRIVRISVGLGIIKVRVTGGEPLVRKDIVGFLRSLGRIEELRDISLTTNGILLEELAEDMFDAGIRRINVSLDSLLPERYRTITRVGDLDRVLRGILAVHRIGYAPIKINVVAIKGFNDDEIMDFARLTFEYPFQIRFIEYMPIGTAFLKNDFEYISNNVIIQTIQKTETLEPVSGHTNGAEGPARVYRIRGAVGEIGIISAISHGFCESCNRLRLTADGSLRTCLLSDEEVDLKGIMRAGCSDAELEKVIRNAILSKPQRSSTFCYEVNRKKCVRSMSAIGG
ncbi:MAG: GTP 3',8-cyclase MoaA [Deltaproteobacteria bacterium]|nr:GTP 3',8-cyclase MoaA [Deltaproteobacteria bacterium]